MILGEVETNAPILLSEKTVVDRFICGCCSQTIEMISGCATRNDKQNSFGFCRLFYFINNSAL